MKNLDDLPKLGDIETLDELSLEQLNEVSGGDFLGNIAGTILGAINMGCSALGLGAPLSMAGGTSSGSGGGSESWKGPLPRLPSL
jgi:hypothetical protein